MGLRWLTIEMKSKINAIYLSLGLMVLAFGCREPKEEVKEVKYQQPKEAVRLPVQMIKSPDGTLYFPENIHRPKSDGDSVVMVYPSDQK